MNDKKQSHFTKTTERKVSNVIIAVFSLFAFGYQMDPSENNKNISKVMDTLAERLGTCGYDEVMGEFAHSPNFIKYIEENEGKISIVQCIHELTAMLLFSMGGVENFNDRVEVRRQQLREEARDWRNSKVLNPNREGVEPGFMDALVGMLQEIHANREAGEKHTPN